METKIQDIPKKKKKTSKSIIPCHIYPPLDPINRREFIFGHSENRRQMLKSIGAKNQYDMGEREGGYR